MMATVSELSMYQATAMKLTQENADREASLGEQVGCYYTYLCIYLCIYIYVCIDLDLDLYRDEIDKGERRQGGVARRAGGHL